MSNGAFNSYMIYFVVISMLSLGVKVGVGTSGNCENCAMGGERIGLLQSLLDLWRRRGSGLASVLTWGLVLIGTGYVICGTTGGYVIWGVGGGCGRLVVA
jgi:hypothetical protein